MSDFLRDYINRQFIGKEPFEIVVRALVVALGVWTAGQAVLNAGDIKKTVLRKIFGIIKAIPAVGNEIQKKTDETMTHLRASLHVDSALNYSEIPEHGLSSDQVLIEMANLKKIDESKYKSGKISGCIYLGDDEHNTFLAAAYGMFSMSNPLHPEIFPSVRKFEGEIIRMTASLMHGDAETCGAMTSGGTESILMAIRAYKVFARSRTSTPELIVPVSVHAAFDKGCEYFGVKIVHIPLDKDMKVNLGKVRQAINKNTIAIVGSAPGFPHGIIDPIPELAKIAHQHNVGFHVDTCLGGFVLPFAEELGYDIQPFDFRLPGVTSMSADVHKYGFTPKGTSVILFRNNELRHCMYFVAEDWPGGAYASPTIAGSRPGGLIAGAWASLVSIGKHGYMKYVDGIMKTTQEIVEGIKAIPELSVVGEPKAMVVAFESKVLDVYKVNAAMTKRGWSLNALQFPSSVHICVTAKHIGLGPSFIKDLRESVADVKRDPDQFKKTTAAMYGLVATLPDRSIVRDIAANVLDVMLEP